MNVPDWLWQGLVEEATSKAIWAGIAFSAGWAWKKREAIAQRLRRPHHITRTVTDKLGVTDTARDGGGTLTAGTQAQILYNVEAPTPSLARRLEDLVAWYLHVS